VNEENDDFLPSNFRFIDRPMLGKGVEPTDASFRAGCNCESDEDCMYTTCYCLDEVVSDSDSDGDEAHKAPTTSQRRKRIAYYTDGENAGLLRDEYLDPANFDPIYECHEGCRCSKNCPNRVVERGRTLPLQIFRTKDRGWGVRCPIDIKKGQFIDTYIGEIITSDEANRRRKETVSKKKDVYLFALDKFSNPESPDPRLRGPPLEVDGEFVSGPTRFINHSCTPNLRIFARVGDHADKHIHDLAFFALEDIPAGTELTFDYVNGVVEKEDKKQTKREKDVIGQENKGVIECRCGSENCRGWIF